MRFGRTERPTGGPPPARGLRVKAQIPRRKKIENLRQYAAMSNRYVEHVLLMVEKHLKIVGVITRYHLDILPSSLRPREGY